MVEDDTIVKQLSLWPEGEQVLDRIFKQERQKWIFYNKQILIIVI